MKKESKNIFFVEVREPNEVKRNILESLKDIVGGLQRFEKFKDIREEKIRNINKLRKDLKNINKHISGLKNLLPETKLRDIKLKHAVKESKKARRRHKGKNIVEEKMPLTELEKLQSELSVIEDKLKGLQ